MKLFRFLALGLLCLVSLLGLEGCSLTQHWTVNPDGSGKVTIAMRLPACSELSRLNNTEGYPPAYFEDQYANLLRFIILHFDGIEAWKDAVYTEENHQTIASLTGYFPDQSKLDSDLLASSGKPGEAGGLFVSQKKDAQGNWVITMREALRADQTPSADDKTLPADLSREDRRQAQQYRILLQQTVPKLSLAVAWISPDWGFHSKLTVGGTIVKAEGLQTDGHSLAWKDETLADDWKDLEKLVDDEDYWAVLVHEFRVSGFGPGNYSAMGNDPEFLATMRKLVARAHVALPVTQRLTVKPGLPAFDYAREVADARANPGRLVLAAMQGDHGSTAATLPPGTTQLGVVMGAREGERDPVVKEVNPDSPAERAGLRTGDVVEKFNGDDVVTTGQFTARIRAMRPGDKVTLEIRRGAEHRRLEATLEAAKPAR